MVVVGLAAIRMSLLTLGFRRSAGSSPLRQAGATAVVEARVAGIDNGTLRSDTFLLDGTTSKTFSTSRVTVTDHGNLIVEGAVWAARRSGP
jgi:hypothetical protein